MIGAARPAIALEPVSPVPAGSRSLHTVGLPATWPLWALFVLFPFWWLAGVSSFIWPIVALFMIVALISRGRTRAPVAIILWFAFVSWVFMSGLQIESHTKLLTFSYRLSLYAAAGILFVYVYNLPRSGRQDIKVLHILTFFWMFVIVAGYAGILLRGYQFIPPFDRILPASLRNKAFVRELVQPAFAQVQSFLGYPVPRPAAPFAYTNQWGGNMAVLTMIALAAVSVAKPGPRRRLIIAMMIVSLVPIVISLNRGMFLSMGLGIAYVMIRLAVRGRLGTLAAVLTLVGLAVVIVSLTPLGHLVVSSFSSTHGNSNNTRLSLYSQAIAGAKQSPIFGHGSPQQVGGTTASPPIGTQGELWMLLFSSGFPAVGFFISFSLVVLWQTRRAASTAALWLHVVPLVALSQIAVYGWLPVEVQLVMVASALAYRLSATADPDARPSRRRRAAVRPAGRSAVQRAPARHPDLQPIPVRP